MNFNSTILVVDDNKVVREDCKKIIEQECLSVITVANGQEALTKLAVQSFVLALVDMKISVMDGMTLLYRIRKNYPNTDVNNTYGFTIC